MKVPHPTDHHLLSSIQQIFEAMLSEYRASREPSPFHDSAYEHVFSDWLLASAFDLGYDLYHLVPGALPDLSDIVVSCGRERRWVQTSLQKLKTRKFGHLVKKYFKGRHIFDLGSGDPHFSIVPDYLSRWSGAAGYWALDAHHIADVKIERDVSGFLSVQAPADLRWFCTLLDADDSTIVHKVPKIFLLSGLELQNFDSLPDRQCAAKMMGALISSCQRDDGILLSVSSRDFNVEDSTFMKVYEDAYIEFFVKKA